MSKVKKSNLRFSLSTLLLLFAAIPPWFAYQQSKQKIKLLPQKIVELKHVAGEIVVTDPSLCVVAKPHCYFAGQFLINIHLPELDGHYYLRIRSSNGVVDVQHELDSGIHSIECKMSYYSIFTPIKGVSTSDIYVDGKVVAAIADQFESSLKICEEIESGQHQVSTRLKLLKYRPDDFIVKNSTEGSLDIWIERVFH